MFNEKGPEGLNDVGVRTTHTQRAKSRAIDRTNPVAIVKKNPSEAFRTKKERYEVVKRTRPRKNGL